MHETGRRLGLGLLLATCGLLSACPEAGDVSLEIRFPDAVSLDRAQRLEVFALEPSIGTGTGCTVLEQLDGEIDPLLFATLGSATYDKDPAFPARPSGLTGVPTGRAVLFFARADSATGSHFLLACAEVTLDPQADRLVVLDLQWICGGLTVELCINEVDDDCDGMTDADDPDGCADCLTDADCPLPENPCLVVSCDPDLRCVQSVNGGIGCDDTDPCTLGDTCRSDGVCRGEALDCSLFDTACRIGLCRDGSCTTEDLSSEYCFVDPCTEGSCLAGECVGANPCDDGDACTDDFCTVVDQGGVPARQCEYVPAATVSAEGPPGDPSCSNGADDDCDGELDLQDLDCFECLADSECDRLSINYPELYQCVTSWSCDLANHRCEILTSSPDGSGCDDGNACTETDSCAAGRCRGQSLDCNLGSACLLELACDPGFGCRYHSGAHAFDVDGDGHGEAPNCLALCLQPEIGTACVDCGDCSLFVDCQEDNIYVFAGAPEVCRDALDGDCDGTIDETCRLLSGFLQGKVFDVDTGVSSGGDIEVALGDIDGDGIADVVWNDPFPDLSIYVALGQRAPDFELAPGGPVAAFTPDPPETWFSRPRLSDLDRDGFLDLAYIEEATSRNIVVRFGSGDPTFPDPPVVFPRGSPASGVHTFDVFDIDADGLEDLLVFEYSYDGAVRLDVYRHDATAPRSFARDPNSPITPGTRYYDSAVGDVDGDGYPDVTVLVQIGSFPDPTSERLYLYHNSGPPDFELVPLTSWHPILQEYWPSLADNYPALEAADIDEDGKSDLVLLGIQEGTDWRARLLVLFATGDPSRPYDLADNDRFELLEPIDIYNGYPADLLSGDVDGDGSKDVAVWDPLARRLSVFRNRGHRNLTGFYFSLPPLVANGIQAPSNPDPPWVQLFDLNGDGLLDFTFFGRHQATTRLVGNLVTTTGRAAPATGSWLGWGQPAAEGLPMSPVVALGDLDGNGIDDLVVGSSAEGVLDLWTLRAGERGPDLGWRGDFETRRLVGVLGDYSPGLAGLWIQRLDTDDAPDLLVLGRDSRVLTLLGDGTPGGFGSAQELLGQGTGALPGSQPVDLNRDRVPDLVLATPEDIAIYLGTRSTTHPLYSLTGVHTVSVPGTGPLALVDLDRDGRLDLLVYVEDTHSISLFSGLGTGRIGDGTFPPTATNVFVGPVGAATMQVVDLDGDRQLDLLLGDGGSPSLWWMRGQAGSFAAPVEMPLPGDLSAVSWLQPVRLDGDGVPDFLVGDGVRFLGLRGILIGQDWVFTTVPTGELGGQLLTAGDLDHDGRPDLLFRMDDRLLVQLGQ